MTAMEPVEVTALKSEKKRLSTITKEYNKAQSILQGGPVNVRVQFICSGALSRDSLKATIKLSMNHLQE